MARDESREASASYGRLRPSGVCCVSASVGRLRLQGVRVCIASASVGRPRLLLVCIRTTTDAD